MADNVFAAWDKLLNPKTLKQNLIAASVFLASYEMLKEALKEHLRVFFSSEWTAETGWKTSPDYREKVLSLDKKEMVACAKWFQQMGALKEGDLVALSEIDRHRNVIAHELPTILGSTEKDVSLHHLRLIYELTAKIDRWWLREIEIPTDPDWDDREIDEEQVNASMSMRMVIMSLLIQVAEGNDDALEGIYKEWSDKMKDSKGGTVQ